MTLTEISQMMLWGILIIILLVKPLIHQVVRYFKSKNDLTKELAIIKIMIYAIIISIIATPTIALIRVLFIRI